MKHMQAPKLVATCVALLASSYVSALSEQAMQHLLNSMLSERQISSLIETTGSRESIELTVAKINTVATNAEGPGAWAYEWRRLGEYYEQLGNAAADKGFKESALKHYNSAMTLYGMGYRPDHYFVEEKRSYARFRDVRYKINAFLEFPFELVTVPFEGGEVKVHLYVPANIDKPPLVLYTGGIDGSKEVVNYASQGLGAKGIAVASFDLLGTGENTQWNATPDAARLHVAILDYFENTGDFDYQRIGAIGGSYGGYYVLQLVVDDPRIKAAINHCGLVHSAFQGSPEYVIQGLQHQPSSTMRSAMRRFGLDPDAARADNFNAMQISNPPSLVDRGYVGQGKKTIHIPLLTVNGARDPVVSMDDIRLVEDAASDGETWLLGHGVHCAPSYMKAAKPHMVEWLSEQLTSDD